MLVLAVVGFDQRRQPPTLKCQTVLSRWNQRQSVRSYDLDFVVNDQSTSMTAQLQPRVVLMDVRMPRLDSVMATQRINSADQTSRCWCRRRST
jgi:CheY-like chemotaxis protein